MKKLIVLSFLFLTLASCSDEKNNQNSPNVFTSGNTGKLPKTTGKASEILLVADNDFFEDTLKTIFDETFSSPAIGPYIYKENIFDYAFKSPKDLDENAKRRRNIIEISITQTTQEETAISFKKDFRSDGQLYVLIEDSDKNRILDYLNNELFTLIYLFEEEETERLVLNYQQNPNMEFKRAASDKFGIDISIPASAFFQVNNTDIIYAIDKFKKETRDNHNTGATGGTYTLQKGIMVFMTNYNSEKDMSPESLLFVRDSVLKYNVTGFVENSYMTTEYQSVHKPKIEYFDLDDKFKTAKIEGLWIHGGVEEASGGGPFIQISIYYPKYQKIIHVNTFIFGPYFEKRDFIRELRAILRTVSIVEEN